MSIPRIAATLAFVSYSLSDPAAYFKDGVRFYHKYNISSLTRGIATRTPGRAAEGEGFMK